MNGQTMNFDNYYKYLSTMEAPIMPSALPKRKINFSNLVKYAKDHNIDIASLSVEEKENIIKLFELNKKTDIGFRVALVAPES